jgi:cell division protein FtsW
LPDWIDGALAAAPPRHRAPSTARAPGARRSPARAAVVLEGQTSLDLDAAGGVQQRGSRRRATTAPPGVANRWLLIIATVLLLLFGLVMAYSASSGLAFVEDLSSFYFIKRQLLYAAVGVVIMLILARIDYEVWRRLAWPVAATVGFLLCVVLVPGVGSLANGARRWIDVGGATLQPSELAKPAAVILAAALAAQRPKDLLRFGRLAAVAATAFLPFAVLILAGKDLSTTAIVALAVATVLVVGGARWRHLLSLAAFLPVMFGLLVAAEPYRLSRLTAFLDPWSHASKSGFQTTQALIAVASGGLGGAGLGDSVQKFGWLPEQSTDMITGVIGEELGLFGLILLIGLYVLLAWAGLRIARDCKEPFGKCVAAGITAAIVGQALLNLAAALGLVPVLGIPLPLVSCGGSSLVAVLAGIGILLNIATNRRSFIVATADRRSRTHGGRRHGRSSVARAGGR